MVPRENKNIAYAKFGGDKQRILWYFPKWPIDNTRMKTLYSILCSFMQHVQQTVNTINKESMELLYVSLHIWHLLLSKRFITDRREEFRPKLSEVRSLFVSMFFCLVLLR